MRPGRAPDKPSTPHGVQPFFGGAFPVVSRCSTTGYSPPRSGAKTRINTGSFLEDHMWRTTSLSMKTDRKCLVQIDEQRGDPSLPSGPPPFAQDDSNRGLSNALARFFAQVQRSRCARAQGDAKVDSRGSPALASIRESGWARGNACLLDIALVNGDVHRGVPGVVNSDEQAESAVTAT